MLVLHRDVIVQAICVIFLVWIDSTSLVQGKNISTLCPIGFKRAFTEDQTVCYRKKDPENFSDLYKDCSHNNFSLDLYTKLDIDKSNAVWSEYKNAYPGGPFIDTRFTDHLYHELDSKYKVTFQNQSLELEDDLCIVIDPVQSYMAVRCDEKHYRYCFVEPMAVDDDDRVKEKCKDLEGSLSFSSPVPTCLTVLSGTTERRKSGSNETVPVRATWNQAQDLCEKKGGSSLLNRGWRYANHPRLLSSKKPKTYPLGIIMTADHSLLRYHASGDHGEIPPSEWNFKYPVEGTNLLGALTEDIWHLVNSSYIFFDVICERTIKCRNLSIELYVDEENKLVLQASDHINTEDVYCFTDSESKYPNIVKAQPKSDKEFILAPESNDGYYWCIYHDPITKRSVKTNNALFIREKDSLLNVYAVKFRSRKDYNLDNFEKRRLKWEKHLKEYIYYTTKYLQYFKKIPASNNTEEILKNFKRSTGDMEIKNEKVIRRIQTKRKYLDGETVLYHVHLYPEMKAVPPGKWDSLEVLYMRPVYNCKELQTEYGETVPRIPMGNAVTVGCVTYKCVGDFNEGVQWVATAREGCARSTTERLVLRVEDEAAFRTETTQPTTASDSTSEISEEYDSKRPSRTSTTTAATTDHTEDNDTTTETVATAIITTEEVLIVTTPWTTTEVTSLATEPTPITPEDQLQQVMDDLDRLVNDSVSMDNITTVFGQVNNILEVDDGLEIPGRLLHLLDQLGAAVNLNGSYTATAVSTNVALLVGDADPDRPIRGLRIATRNTDQFTNDSFEIMTQVADSAALDPDNNEAVIQLPASVAASARRISFVVFRNDRAFRAAPGAPLGAPPGDPGGQRTSVNSRVLSVNVQNLTQFEKGEVIDIHISPITANISRNESRTCAYWHFTGDDATTGYWSQDGCTFIRATRPGVLDTCRCDHLTHFAEILVPRTLFSEKNESALEVISIVGCCLSILGLIMVAATAILFRTWRRDFNNKIWLQLCISILFMSICFLVIAFAKFDHYNIGCMLVGIAMHYSVLCSFCWMLVAAVISYRRLVLVFTREASHKLLRASAFSYGAPCAVIGILLSVAPHSYAGRFEEKTPSGSFCYPSGLGLWLAVYAPIAAMLLANWILFAIIVRSVFATKRIQRHGDSNEALRCASVSCLLVFLFGLPWIFGLFAYNIVSAYLFTLTVTFQGFILFMFFVLGNKKTRDLWLNKLKIKQTRKVPVTSSTFTNRSTGYRGVNPPSTLEGKASKPRSLTSSDDSKFS